MSIVIAFEKNKIIGGYGDRVIGLISCRVISYLLNKKFYILWNKENLKEYIDYSKYDFELLNNKSNDIKIYNCIDSRAKKIKKYLVKSENLFNNEINKFYLNQEISHYLCKNKLFRKGDYFFRYIFYFYKRLYTNIFIPTNKSISKINSIINDKKNIIGIQIRSGDIHMETNKDDIPEKRIYYSRNMKFNPATEIKNILNKIKIYCDKEYDNYNVFITSDYNDIYKLSLEIWNESNIIYNHDIVQHLDRKAINNDISKTFIDNYILSQKTRVLFISDYSNYGRVAALSSVHDNIFSLNIQKLDKKNLLSKNKLSL